uniref:Uncharacterized protein n=1 Tax=Ananas comosus var. bracteatus TaxID=296719 RepID=A0A6V7P9H5_ANACO|nr:unnamed protein product [Ananas comosus var. bracteatus]
MGETGPPVNSAARPARQPVPGSRDRSPSASARGLTGPAQGETGSRTLDFRGQAERPVPGRGDRSLWAKTAQTGLIERRREGEEEEEEEAEKELAWRPWSTIFFLISRLWRLGACFWSFVEDQTSTLLGFELGLELLLRLDWKDSSSHLEIERASFAIGY